MKELIAQLVEKANLNEEQANKAVEVVKGFLGGQVEGFLTGENIMDVADKAKGLLGGLFGNKE